MKVAYITASFPYGNGESFFAPEIEELSKSIDLIVIPLYPRGKKNLNWNPTKNTNTLEKKLMNFSMALSLGKELMLSNRIRLLIKEIWKNKKSKRNFIKNLFVFPKAIWLSYKLKKLNVDHIHAQWGSTTATLAMITHKLSGISWSFTCHRWDIYENNLLELKSNSANFVRFISHKGMNDAIALGVNKTKSHLIPMGVKINEQDIIEAKSINYPLKILCAANLIEVKGHSYLIDAIDILKKENINVQLTLAGNGSLENELKRKTLELNLSESIEFTGHLPNKSIISMYENKEIDLFILPSIDLGNGHHEGVPVSLMEAMSYSIPVISTKTGSIEELLPETTNLTIKEKSSLHLAEKIKELYLNHDFYIDSSKNVFNIIKETRNIELIISELLLLIRKTNS